MKNHAPMNTTFPRNHLLFTSAFAALALVWCARQAEAAASASSDRSGTWTATAAGALGYGCAAALLPDGNVLLAGRAGSGDYTNSQIYEVASGKWTITSALNERRCGPTATLLRDGRVLAAGGQLGKGYVPDDGAGVINRPACHFRQSQRDLFPCLVQDLG